MVGRGIEGHVVRRMRSRSGGGVLVVLALALLSTPAVAAGESHGDQSGAEICTPRGNRLLPPGCLNPVAGQAREVVEPEQELPNLVPMAPTYLDIGPAPRPATAGVLYTPPPAGEPPVLRFTTIVANRGSHPLELLGVPSTEPGRATAYQCVAWTGPVCRDHVAVGDVSFHADHGHFHVNDFASYELRSVLADGSPDWSAAGLLAESPKVSFCLQDSSDVSAEDESPRRYAGCPGVIQGISPGWADIYDSSLVGQSLPIAGRPDGTYALVYTIDPGSSLVETSTADNTAFSIVELAGGGTTVRVVGG